MLPTQFPLWQTVYCWFRRLVRSFLYQIIHDVTLMLDRQTQERDAQATAAMIDSQPLKARLRRRQTDQRSQAPYCRRCRQALADGAVDASLHRQLDQCTAGARCAQAALTLGQAFICRRRVRPAPAARQGRLPRLRG